MRQLELQVGDLAILGALGVGLLVMGQASKALNDQDVPTRGKKRLLPPLLSPANCA